MFGQEDNTNLGKHVFHDSNQQRKLWAWLGQSCSRFKVVFLSQLFVILLIMFGCFWKIRFSKTCDESLVWMGISYRAAICFSLSAKQ